MNKTTVSFVYDDECGKWEIQVIGVANEKEAAQALNAVLLTASEAVVFMHHKVTKDENDPVYTITPAIMPI